MSFRAPLSHGPRPTRLHERDQVAPQIRSSRHEPTSLQVSRGQPGAGSTVSLAGDIHWWLSCIQALDSWLQVSDFAGEVHSFPPRPVSSGSTPGLRQGHRLAFAHSVPRGTGTGTVLVWQMVPMGLLMTNRSCSRTWCEGSPAALDEDRTGASVPGLSPQSTRMNRACRGPKPKRSESEGAWGHPVLRTSTKSLLG